MKKGIREKGQLAFKVAVHRELCEACGTCERVCRLGAIKVHEKAEILDAKCSSCALCMSNCPNQAIYYKIVN